MRHVKINNFLFIYKPLLSYLMKFYHLANFHPLVLRMISNSPIRDEPSGSIGDDPEGLHPAQLKHKELTWRIHIQTTEGHTMDKRRQQQAY